MTQLFKKISVFLFAFAFLFPPLIYPLHAQASSTLLNGIQVYWKLDGNANNSVSSNYNGTNYSITYGTAYGKINQGASFNGSNSRIEGMKEVNNSGTNSYSFAFWMYMPSLPTTNTFQVIVDEYDTSPKTVQIGIGGPTGVNGLRIALPPPSGSTDDVIAPLSYFSANTWTHVTCTIQNNGNYTSTLTIYVNGVQAAQATGNLNTSYIGNTTLHVGVGYYNGNYNSWYNGYLDEIGEWNRVLTATEAASLYNSGIGNQYPFNTPPPSPAAPVPVVLPQIYGWF